MTPCVCSMSSIQFHSPRPCCSLSQLRSGRRIPLSERLGQFSDSTAVTSASTSRYCNIDRKATLIHSSSSGSFISVSKLQKTLSRQNGVSVGYDDSKKTQPRRKLVVEVKYRVQDTVDSGAVTEDGTDYARRRNRERNRKHRYGDRRRRVQILGNNGVVDLEEHLGIIKDDENISTENYRTEDSSGEAVRQVSTLEADEGRNLLESSLLNKGIEELERTDECIKSTPSDGTLLPEQIRKTEGDIYSISSQAGFSEDVIEIELAEEVPNVSFSFNEAGQRVWDKNDMQGLRSLAALPGGKRVVELVAAWDGLAGRLPPEFLRTTGSDLLLRALKLTVIALQRSTADDEGRTPLYRALAVAHTLADLGMDAEVISTGLLREVVDSGLITYAIVEKNLGANVARLLRDCSRVRRIPSRVETLDDDSAKALRQFCLAFHDVSAVVVELASQLDTMKHIHSIPRYRQQILALETMQIYAPLAHAIGTSSIALELEDLGFRVLFPDSYSYIENWLRSRWIDGSVVVDQFKEQLTARLEQDPELKTLVTTVNVLGRYKSRFSTMRKLLRDGRKPEEVYDVLGLRVILESKSNDESDIQKAQGVRACYRAFEIATTMWEEVPGRFKDYIAHRKENGYESLHLAVRVSDEHDRHPPMEIQIRTADMDAAAVSGEASHALYKGGMTDPEQIRNLKLLMVEAANAAASRFGEIAGNAVALEGVNGVYDDKDEIFKMFDKNQDGVISVEEFREVITELGADEGDALELMEIVDSNTDGLVSAEEFSKFRHQIQISQNLAGVDREFSSQLGSKLLVSKENEGIQHLLTSERESGNVERLIAHKLERFGSLADAKTFSGQQSMSSTVDGVSAEFSTQTYEVDKSESTNFTNVQDSAGGESTTKESFRSTKVDDGDGKTLPLVRKKKPKLVKPVPALGNLPSPILQEVLISSPTTEMETTKSPKGLEAPLDEDVDEDSAVEQELSTIRQLTAAGNLEAARMRAVQLSKKCPGNTKALLHQASLERKCGRWKVASYLYGQAVDNFRLKQDFGVDYVRALHAWASLEGEIGNGMTAKQLFEESVNASLKGDAESDLRGAGVYGLHGWARLEEKSGNWSKARDLLERASSIQPGNAVIHQSRASLEARVHNYSAARIHFNKAVEAAPEDVICWHAWANFEGSRRNFKKMRQLFQKALEIDPRNVHSLQAWARHEGLNGTQESRSQARKLYQKLADINPKSVYCWQSWGILEQEDENFEGARVLFDRGLKVDKNSVPCLQAYAHMERKCGNLDKALKLLQRALTVEPSNAAVLMELALITEKSGNEDLALDFYKQAGRMDRRNSLIKRRMFESRKEDMNSSQSKSKAASRWRRLRSKPSKSGEGSTSDELKKRYERIHPGPPTGLKAQ